jgi:hypothetical protein
MSSVVKYFSPYLMRTNFILISIGLLTIGNFFIWHRSLFVSVELAVIAIGAYFVLYPIVCFAIDCIMRAYGYIRKVVRGKQIT